MELLKRINNAPMSRYQWVIVATCVWLNMLDGFDVLGLFGGRIGERPGRAHLDLHVGEHELHALEIG